MDTEHRKNPTIQACSDHLSEIISHILEPIVKMRPGDMEMTSTGDFIALVDSINKMVSNGMVQDKGNKIQVVGSDVEALYPSLEAVEVAEIVSEAVLNTKIKFENIDWVEGCKYIAITSTEQECRLGPLKRVLPRYHGRGSPEQGHWHPGPVGVPQLGQQRPDDEGEAAGDGQGDEDCGTGHLQVPYILL